MKANQFNDCWQVRYLEDEGPGVPVTLPHDAMLSEPRTELSAGGVNTGWYEGRDYRYTKVFTPDHTLAGQTAVLEFEGVYHNAEVWLNGEKLAFRPYDGEAPSRGREHPGGHCPQRRPAQLPVVFRCGHLPSRYPVDSAEGAYPAKRAAGAHREH